MFKSIIFLWNLINPKTKSDIVFGEENIRKCTPELLKTFFVFVLLVITSMFYYEIQQVPLLELEIESQSLFNSDYQNCIRPDVEITYNYSSHDYIRYHESNGMVDRTGIMIEYVDSTRSSLDNFICWNNREGHIDRNHEELIDSLISLDKPDNIKKIADSINSIAYFSVRTNERSDFSLFHSFGPLWSKRNIWDYRKGWEYERRKSIYGYGDSKLGGFFEYFKLSFDKENKVLGEQIYYFVHNISGAVHIQTCSPLGFFGKRNSIFSAEDISRAVVRFRVKNSFLRSLKYNFIGATDFSHMSPEPDIYDYNSITFTDPEKLRKIAFDELIFHVTFPDMENVQQTRNFFITMILSLLVTIFLKLVYNLTRLPLKLFYVKCYKTAWTILAFAMIVSILFCILYIYKPWYIGLP